MHYFPKDLYSTKNLLDSDTNIVPKENAAIFHFFFSFSSTFRKNDNESATIPLQVLHPKTATTNTHKNSSDRRLLEYGTILNNELITANKN